MQLQKPLYSPSLSPETLVPSLPPMCFLDSKDLADLNSDDDGDDNDNDQFELEWYRRLNRDSLSLRRRAEHVSPGHHVSHKPEFYR